MERGHHVEMSKRSRGSVRVHPVGRSDVGKVVPCLVRAFWNFPETRHLLPAERARRRVLPRFLRSDARDAAGFQTLLAASQDDAVVGAAVWLPPLAYPVSLRRRVNEAMHLLPAAPWALGTLREAARGQAANRQHHAGCPPHYWLRAIGVDLERHGEGVGKTLMRPMLEQADARGRGCFLFTATAPNVTWYESFGFTVLSMYHPTSTWPQVWAMWRGTAGGSVAS